MAGVYIHIPFCKKACHYCNFHFSTSLNMKDQMVDAIVKEIHLRKDYLSPVDLTSIYFGGGTPSLLEKDDLGKIFDALSTYYNWSDSCEITLECNPDDLNFTKIKELQSIEINRLSIGIQSFHDEDLQSMNRAHNANEAISSIKTAQDKGIENITIDLIYGSDTTTDEMWISNIDQAIALDIPHISSYALTVEENTALAHMIASGKRTALDEEKASHQFNLLIDRLTAKEFIHYEISNFGKEGQFAVHNSNYWKGKPYLGIGPSAHSYDGDAQRSWNIAHNIKYIDNLMNDVLPLEIEHLSKTDKYNELVLTKLRTIWGIDEAEIKQSFPEFHAHFEQKVAHYTSESMLMKEGKTIKLTNQGKHFADRIAMELFHEE